MDEIDSSVEIFRKEIFGYTAKKVMHVFYEESTRKYRSGRIPISFSTMFLNFVIFWGTKEEENQREVTSFMKYASWLKIM